MRMLFFVFVTIVSFTACEAYSKFKLLNDKLEAFNSKKAHLATSIEDKKRVIYLYENQCFNAQQEVRNLERDINRYMTTHWDITLSLALAVGIMNAFDQYDSAEKFIAVLFETIAVGNVLGNSKESYDYCMYLRDKSHKMQNINTKIDELNKGITRQKRLVAQDENACIALSDSIKIYQQQLNEL